MKRFLWIMDGLDIKEVKSLQGKYRKKYIDIFLKF